MTSTPSAPLPGSIVEAFADIVQRYPQRIAVSGARSELRYAELSERADALAVQLQQRGVGSGDIVGMFMPRSPEAIIAMLAILKVGAAYLPFDTSYPQRLLRHLYEDAAPSTMLVQGRHDELPFWDGPALDLDALPQHTQATAFTAVPLPADSLAYVMYTSGSTGRPKGVCIAHRGVLRLVVDADYVELNPDQVLLQLAPLSFDASTFEIWGALLNGARLAICEQPRPSLDDIGRLIADHGVTTLWLTAGIFHLMVDHRLSDLAPLRQLLAGGDVLSPAHVARVLRELPECRVINGYGPTENTTFSCCYNIARDPLPVGAIPIGTPINRTQAYVVDEAGCVVAEGHSGELFLGGEGLAIGYLNQPELTAARFVAHPFDPTPGARLYRTGDRVRRSADGLLEFLGRNDRQVKINGKRIELDEIEQSLRQSGLVEDAATVSFETAGHTRIAAFAVPRAGASMNVERLRCYLRAELPDYMMPAVIRLLDALPLSPTGKIDRARLPLPSLTDQPAPTSASRMQGIDPALQRLWSAVLGGGEVAADDNFFDLGGTSLQMIRLHAQLCELHPQTTLLDLFRHPTLRQLSAWLHDAPAATAHATTLDAAGRAARRQQALLAARTHRPGRPRTAP